MKKSQVGIKNGKKPKIFQFSMFLCNFCHDFDCLRRLECWLKTFIKVAVCYPVVFKDEIVSVFWLKMSQLDTENDKNLKILQFSKFYAVFL